MSKSSEVVELLRYNFWSNTGVPTKHDFCQYRPFLLDRLGTDACAKLKDAEVTLLLEMYQADFTLWRLRQRVVGFRNFGNGTLTLADPHGPGHVSIPTDEAWLDEHVPLPWRSVSDQLVEVTQEEVDDGSHR